LVGPLVGPYEATTTANSNQRERESTYVSSMRACLEPLILRETLGPEHLALAESLHVLGSCYAVQGRYAEAEPLYKRALEIREEALRPENPELAPSLET